MDWMKSRSKGHFFLKKRGQCTDLLTFLFQVFSLILITCIELYLPTICYGAYPRIAEL